MDFRSKGPAAADELKVCLVSRKLFRALKGSLSASELTLPARLLPRGRRILISRVWAAADGLNAASRHHRTHTR